MTWLRKHRLHISLHVLASALIIFVLTRETPDWDTPERFEPMLESGVWALRLLLLCLAMTPLATYLGWKAAIGLRKPLGLWAFGFALAHAAFYLRADPRLTRWKEPELLFLLVGALALLILTALALTSNRRAMRWLGRRWKRLHRLVYIAGIATVAHALLAAAMSKKMSMFDPYAIHELRIMAALLAVLLIVRIPQVRRHLQPALAALHRPPDRPQTDLQGG
jgi:sulfoxide reductase heme-binding subunit YedZ